MKPPYRLPTMVEVEAAEKTNGLTAISTFSGAGGSSLGYRIAGYDVLAACEFIPAAISTYRSNSTAKIVTRDIREVSAAELLEGTGVGVGELDLLDGSPPCASFSTAGKRSSKWGEVSKYSSTEQRTDDLFYEYARLVRELQPRAFVAENVTGLVRGVAKGYFKRILSALADCGYRVEARVLDASWLGVAQQRERVFFVGIRNDLGKRPAFPAPFPYRYTLADAFPYLRYQVTGDFTNGSTLTPATAAPSKTVGATWNTGNGNAPSSVVVDRAPQFIARTAPQFGWSPNSVDEPARTITLDDRVFIRDADGLARDPETGQSLDVIPTYLRDRYPGVAFRRITLGELRAICGFPPDFVLTGSHSHRWERLGRSVPPPMAAAVGRAVAGVLT